MSPLQGSRAGLIPFPCSRLAVCSIASLLDSCPRNWVEPPAVNRDVQMPATLRTQGVCVPMDHEAGVVGPSYATLPGVLGNAGSVDEQDIVVKYQVVVNCHESSLMKDVNLFVMIAPDEGLPTVEHLEDSDLHVLGHPAGAEGVPHQVDLIIGSNPLVPSGDEHRVHLIHRGQDPCLSAILQNVIVTPVVIARRPSHQVFFPLSRTTWASRSRRLGSLGGTLNPVCGSSA